MKKITSKNLRRIVRHNRVRTVLAGTAERPRLSVFRSLKSTYVQLVDDNSGRTLVAASSNEVDTKAKQPEGMNAKVAVAYQVGEKIAEKAKTKNITKVVFDRAGYKYHGRVKAVADGARAGGLQF
ncbi:MAG TPA: 50S ribosomal protein L18 [Candidatus Magasanikbacteria bacterium]|nr:50S ribosomal protein L18 [Candidatus Magasanikbacteria bacterium]